MWHLPDPQTQPEFYEDVAMKRLIAFVLDTVLIALITVLVVPFTAFTGLFFFPFLMAAVGFVYRVITIANGSATLGMRLMAIEFRNASGARFDLGQAFLHTVGLNLSFAIMPLQLVSVVLMATTERGQGLTDHVMGSVAINRPARY
ncbi:RDD family protein [Thalassovita litoralis]|jgi:uncharacterized RDD family membrane protein YckC|uniref:RDD family protein n=1 Tax=Thalassovita litoralis TaxID=1010611 RepID=A0A521E5M2_9RHOB|nr:RDD family protein [Thalassovita litoralis]SMO78671.1 RDD family protein [Thalassovita litoralis]